MIRRQRRHTLYVPGLLSFSLLLHAGFPAAGATLTWNGGVSGDWQTGAGGWTNGGAVNWNNATPDAASFAGASPSAVTVNAGGVTVDDISFSATGYSIGGAGTLTLSNSILDVGSGHTATITAALAGTTGLVKSGAGTLVLSGTNKSYSGGTTINLGVVQISSAAAGTLGPATTSSVTLNGGALHANFSANNNVRYAISVGASGGELSRIMLAIEVVLATDQTPQTMVFDEVDAGIGGLTANQVGARLKALADFHQVIVVTHLPQVAALADANFVVEKSDGTARVRPVSNEDKTDEIVRMLGGDDREGAARRHALKLERAGNVEESTS